MIDRYTEEALACYGRLRRLDPGGARAELELFEHLLGMEGRSPARLRKSREAGPVASGRVDFGLRVAGLRPAVSAGHSHSSTGPDKPIRRKQRRLRAGGLWRNSDG